MANYIKATNFAAKDSLPSGNAGKIIKGTEIDVEYNAIASAISSKADTNSPTFTGTPLAPTATAGTSNTQVATTAFVTTATAASFPAGGIIMWSGSIAAIPTGWVLCDGTNGTPNLRDRFVIGAGSSYAVAATGGSKDAVVVAHSHSGSVSGTTGGAGGHSHNITLSSQTGAGVQPLGATNNSAGTGSTQAVGDHSHSFSGSFSTSSAGVSGTNANLPPYYALAYIMKT
jgi:hypothetical protein